METVYQSIKGILNARLGASGAAQANANQPKLSLIDRGRKAMGIPVGGTSPTGAPVSTSGVSTSGQNARDDILARKSSVAKPQPAAMNSFVAKPLAAATPPVAKPQAAAPKVSVGANSNIDSSTREKAAASVANLPKGDQRTDAEKKASADLGSENPEGGPEKRTDAEVKASADLADSPPLANSPEKEKPKANTSTMINTSYDMTINKKFNVSDALYQSVVEVLKKDKKEGSIPSNDKEEDLAAFHGDPKRITHGDVLKARGVTREEIESVEEMSSKMKMKMGLYNKKKTNEESVEEGMGSAAKSMAKKILSKLGGGSDQDQLKNLQGKMGVPQTGKKPVEENKDTPGNSYDHQCAVHVKSESFGEGRTITTQHADPDQDGNIAWYDVMFEHGIEKQVPTTTLEILVSEMHGHSKKKKM